MKLTQDMRTNVKRVIKERFGDNVVSVELESAINDAGDELLFIRVVMSNKATKRDFSGRFFGLTGRVRDALGDENHGVFPVIRPVEANA